MAPESLDVIILRARRMRAKATAGLLARLFAAVIRPFRYWTGPKHRGSDAVIKDGSQGAI